MLLLLSGLTIILTVVSSCYFLKYRYINKKLIHISEALEQQQKTNKQLKKVQFFTEEPSIRRLLVEINNLIETNEQFYVKQHQEKEKNKKMLANISHDLKTPLTVIAGYSEILLKKVETRNLPLLKARLQKIDRQTSLLSAEITKFFDLAKIESGDFFVAEDTIDIVEICRDGLLDHYDIITDKGITIELSLPDQQIWINGDSHSFKRILDNLLSNAIRYGGIGGYLGVEVKQGAEDVRITISDKGPGVLEENREKIFDRLFTQNDSRNKNYQGSGLGLTITKHLTELMDGTIEVYSKPYIRTSFILQFPLDKQKSY